MYGQFSLYYKYVFVLRYYVHTHRQKENEALSRIVLLSSNPSTNLSSMPSVTLSTAMPSSEEVSLSPQPTESVSSVETQNDVNIISVL